MQKSKNFTFQNAIEPQALLNECERRGTKDALSVLTQFLHNSDLSSPKATENALAYLEELKVGAVEPGIIHDRPLALLFHEFFDTPFPDPQKPKFTFIDLFAGMGGFRLAMQAQGGKCVFSSEWDKEAAKTYYSNFGNRRSA